MSSAWARPCRAGRTGRFGELAKPVPIALLLIFGLGLWGCRPSPPRSPGQVMGDVQRFVLLVKGGTDASAIRCQRACNQAAIAAANVLGPLGRKEPVQSQQTLQLQAADKTLLQACAPYR